VAETVTEPVVKPIVKIIITESKVKYDLAFKRWGEFYFPFDDWHWWKSQGMAESNLDPNAISWCGAVGIMQIMPATATELGVENRWDAEESIQGGVKYDKQMWNFWDKIDGKNRKKLTFASYNAGCGNIKKAKQLAESDEWDEISSHLKLITGKHSQETINYVKRIFQIKQNL
jgi:membrane-bound lytic murein transglycosylase F